MKDKILNAISSPKELEALYQGSPEEFQKEFSDIFSQNPESLILQTWHERLTHQLSTKELETSAKWPRKTIFLILIISAIGGTILNLPFRFENIDSYWFFSRNFVAILIISLTIYFFFHKNHTWRSIAITLGIASFTLLYLNLLPNPYAKGYDFYRQYRAFQDAIGVAELHIPLFLWMLAGVAFTGINWRTTSDRMNFVRYNGEMGVYITLVAISAFVLTSLTMALLGIIEKSYELTEWYGENIIMYEVAATPIIATFLIEKVIGKRLNIAPILGKIFTPLLLITTIAYLIIMAVYQRSPYNDRETLITFNILLLLVLGMSIFSLAERNSEAKPGFSDYVNIGLILATITIDLIALAAVLFRVGNDDYGFTPNRIAILGINLLIFIHLVGIFIYYIRFLLKKGSFEKLEVWITKYLSVYAIWAMVVSVALPLLFWYR